MNKNLLIIGAAIGAYALLRPKSGSLIAGNGSSQNTGAATYTPSTYVPSSTPRPAATTNQSSNGNWLTTAAGVATTAAGIVKSGTSIWADISGAFGGGKPAAASTAPVKAADYAGGGDIWAGPQYQTS